MNLRVLLVCLAAAMLIVSVAVAAPPTGKGKPATTGAGCKPKVMVVLSGSLTSASASSLTVNVTRGNRWARAYVEAGSVAVTVNATTKVRRQGKKTPADLVSGDRVQVKAKMCKADLVDEATPGLTAVKVVAHAAKS